MFHYVLSREFNTLRAIDISYAEYVYVHIGLVEGRHIGVGDQQR